MGDDKINALEALFKNMQFIEQFVNSTVSCTSRYNNSMSVSYAPDNLIGKPVRYPNYGDFADTYMLRSYGRWWAKSESAQKEYMPQDTGSIISEDYIILNFEQSVIATRIVIYETYNPGAVVRIWGGNRDGIWTLLWEGLPQNCKQTSRLFSPEIRIIKELVHLIRIDFNQSHLKYHTALDAVLLAGYRSNTDLQSKLVICGFVQLEKSTKPVIETQSSIIKSDIKTFPILPYEIIVYIFGYLDLKSLCACARVNRIFHSASNDITLYRNLCFKRYWHQVNDQTLTYYIPKCKYLCKLDLSWCVHISEKGFVRFLHNCGKFLTHLSVGNCTFIEQNALIAISKCVYLTDLRLRYCNTRNINDYIVLSKLVNLQSLDLHASNIDDHSLVMILQNNPELRYLNLDLCEELSQLDFIALMLATINTKLRSFSCWKSHSLTAEGIKSLSNCTDLRELDVGWALVLNDPGDCLDHIARKCPNLTKLIISSWRGLGDHQLLPIITYSAKMKQLDLLGTRNISADICHLALQTFTDLELLDVSFCDGITQYQIQSWVQEFPHVTIQSNTDRDTGFT